MLVARADRPDEITLLLERARLLAQAREAVQVMRNGGMLFFESDPDLARRYREASIWAGNQPGGGCRDEIEAARFIADLLDPGEPTGEELALAEDDLIDDEDDGLPF